MPGLPYRLAKRVVVFVAGGSLVLVGIVMLVAPGPGLLVVFLGLTLLATEFVWARLWLRRLRVNARRARRRARGWRWWRRERPEDPS